MKYENDRRAPYGSGKNDMKGPARKTYPVGEKADPEKKPYGKREGGYDRKPYGDKSAYEKKPYGGKDGSDKKPYRADKPYEKKPYEKKDSDRRGDKPFHDPKPHRDAYPFWEERLHREEKYRRDEKPFRDDRPFRDEKPYRGRKPEDRPFKPGPGPRVGAIYADVPAPVCVTPVEVQEPEENECLLVGRNPIREALKSGRSVEKLMVANGDLSSAAREIIRMARDAGAVVQQVDRSRLDQIYPAHQGMLAFVASVDYKSVDDMFDYAAEKGEDPFFVILDGITDPHNLGAIIRSAECAGAHGVILPERRAAGLGPAAAKAAAGALNHMRIARVKNLNRTIDELKARNVWVIGTAMDGENALEADLTGPVALVIGSEGDGISHLTLEKCDRTLTLPMKGQIQSLNASVAAGVLLYEVVRARAK